jgi:vacuolar iron transporter family protein
VPEKEAAEVTQVLTGYGVTAAEAGTIVAAMRQRPVQWRDFMMRFELGLEAPDPKRALQSALTIAISYIIGGMIPLSPYLALASTRAALQTSVIVTLIALIVFGYIKGRFTGAGPLRSAVQTTIIGSLAAAAAFGIARAIS